MFQILLHMQVSLGSHSSAVSMATRQTSPCDSAYLDNTLSSRQALEQKAVEYLPAEIRTVTGPAYEARVSVFDTSRTFPKMSQTFVCTHQTCNELYLGNLGVVIDHIRGTHGGWTVIRRPSSLGNPDSHGHLWYCFGCETKLGKDHRSFRSDKAIWNHMNACHDSLLDNIRRT
jgi:hypothetical protein